MKRESLDMALVRPEHTAIHDRLTNWARWCRGGSTSGAVHPMFRGYRHSYEESHARSECDSLDATAVQKIFTQLPEKHRWVICWAYTKPYVPVLRVRQALALTTPALYDMLHDARTMLKNMR